jgi:hypothetical protein
MSKADAFILPLTGINKEVGKLIKSYLSWEKCNIEDYKFVITLDENEKSAIEKVLSMCKNYISENYQKNNKEIFILDISEWALDIEMFLSGKYSKFSDDAKKKIMYYHVNNKVLPTEIYTTLFPNKPIQLYDGKTAIEKLAEDYGFDLEEMKKIGEVGSIVQIEKETLL